MSERANRPGPRREPSSGDCRPAAGSARVLRELAQRPRAARGHDRPGAALRRAELPSYRRGCIQSDSGAGRRIRGGVDGQQHVGVRAPGDRRAADRLRTRSALRAAAALVRSTYPGSRAHQAQARERRRSTCADPSSARCARRRRCRSAGSTRRRSPACFTFFAAGRRAGPRMPRVQPRKGMPADGGRRGAPTGEPAAAA